MSCPLGRVELPAADLQVALLRRAAARGIQRDEVAHTAILEYAASQGIHDVPDSRRLLALLAHRQERNADAILAEALWDFTFPSAS